MKGIVKIFGITLLVLQASRAHAGAEQAGTTAANFLSVGAGAGVLGMGGATLALSTGLGSAAWNPGGLGFIRDGEMTLSHAGLAQESNQEWAALGGRLGWQDFAWSISGLRQGQGSFDGRDASNNPTGSFDVSSMALGAALARPIGRAVSFGVAAKWVSENLGPSTRGSGVTFDAGMMARMGIVGFGAAAQNLGGTMSYGTTAYPFPSSFGAGISVDHAASGMRADLDVNVPNDYYPNVRAGVEWQWRERLALRAGYRRELGAPGDDVLNGPSFGMGAGAHGLWLDYGYVVTTSGEGQHRMGITLKPGQLNLGSGDPFGQKTMRRDFDEPAPAKATATPSKTAPAEPKKPAKTAKKKA